MVYTRSGEFKIRGIVVEARYSGKSEQVQSRGQQGGASQLPKAQLGGARVSQLVEGSRVSQLVPKHNWKVPAGCSNLYLGRCLSKPDAFLLHRMSQVVPNKIGKADQGQPASKYEKPDSEIIITTIIRIRIGVRLAS